MSSRGKTERPGEAARAGTILSRAQIRLARRTIFLLTSVQYCHRESETGIGAARGGLGSVPSSSTRRPPSSAAADLRGALRAGVLAAVLEREAGAVAVAGAPGGDPAARGGAGLLRGRLRGGGSRRRWRGGGRGGRRGRGRAVGRSGRRLRGRIGRRRHRGRRCWWKAHAHVDVVETAVLERLADGVALRECLQTSIVRVVSAR